MNKFKYVVNLGYKEFEFADSVTAMKFAQVAKRAYVPSEHDKNLNVTVDIIETDEVEEEED